jgi:hypothetical protein
LFAYCFIFVYVFFACHKMIIFLSKIVIIYEKANILEKSVRAYTHRKMVLGYEK